MTTLDWPESLSYLTYMSDRIDINYEDIRAEAIKLGGSDDTQKRSVQTTVMNMSWFFKDRKNFYAFVSMLGEKVPSKFIILE